MKEEDIPKADEVINNIFLVVPETIVDFEKAGIFYLQKGEVSGEEYAVKKAKYLGEGKWKAIDKVPLKKKEALKDDR